MFKVLLSANQLISWVGVILTSFLCFQAQAVQRNLVSEPIAGLDLVHNRSVKLKFSEAEKASVVLFLSARCPCSASHEPLLEKLYQKFHPFGFSFVGIHSNADENLELSRSHFQSSGISFPVIHDPGSRFADAFSAYKTPHVYVLNPEGNILFQGGVDDSHQAQNAKRHYLMDALSALQDGRLPAEKFVRVLGCAIKRP